MVLHQPVMVEEVLKWLNPVCRPGAVVVDATVGSGGHAKALLHVAPEIQLIAIDRDPDALQRARTVLEPWQDRITYVHDDFRAILKIVMSHAALGVDAILVDLGMSMDQLKDPNRGFSFELEGPLDMRYNPWDALTARKIVNQWRYEKLVQIFREYGEERGAERVARAILEARKRGPIETTTQLAELVAQVLPRRGRLHPATRIFMALRIAVNRELDGLDRFLVDACKALRIGGRLVVLAYHSLEDRTVKRVSRRLALACRCDPEVGVCLCEGKPLAKILTRKAVQATSDEVKKNPAARSAKLRALEKVHEVKFADLVLKEPKPKPEWPFPMPGGDL